jgi:hypothetical protein
MTKRTKPESERQRVRRAVRIAGQSAAQLIRKVEQDPLLGPKVAAAIERHFRDVVRVKLLEVSPSAWDLLDETRWPYRRRPGA